MGRGSTQFGGALRPAMADHEADTPAVRDARRTRAPRPAALADGPMTRRDLREALDGSRSTVSEALQDVLGADFVTEAVDVPADLPRAAGLPPPRRRPGPPTLA